MLDHVQDVVLTFTGELTHAHILGSLSVMVKR